MGWNYNDLRPELRERIARAEERDTAREIREAMSTPKDFTGEQERNLQSDCEAVLEECGYHRATANNYEDCARDPHLECNGFFAHWAGDLRGLPMMPDLAVFPLPNNRPALLVELKTRNRYQPGQLAALSLGAWTQCARSVGEFRRLLLDWELGVSATFPVSGQPQDKTENRMDLQ